MNIILLSFFIFMGAAAIGGALFGAWMWDYVGGRGE